MRGCVPWIKMYLLLISLHLTILSTPPQRPPFSKSIGTVPYYNAFYCESDPNNLIIINNSNQFCLKTISLTIYQRLYRNPKTLLSANHRYYCFSWRDRQRLRANFLWGALYAATSLLSQFLPKYIHCSF